MEDFCPDNQNNEGPCEHLSLQTELRLDSDWTEHVVNSPAFSSETLWHHKTSHIYITFNLVDLVQLLLLSDVWADQSEQTACSGGGLKVTWPDWTELDWTWPRHRDLRLESHVWLQPVSTLLLSDWLRHNSWKVTVTHLESRCTSWYQHPVWAACRIIFYRICSVYITVLVCCEQTVDFSPPHTDRIRTIHILHHSHWTNRSRRWRRRRRRSLCLIQTDLFWFEPIRSQFSCSWETAVDIRWGWSDIMSSDWSISCYINNWSMG